MRWEMTERSEVYSEARLGLLYECNKSVTIYNYLYQLTQ